ncbi:peptidoglycan DD-metalloendopeptidase family protein [Leeuwenhoekiella sp. NPDC079379]|uniref:peptidoglycan DD-metalloendopeptidase family protein n=1 Tax=Leeuwenhoekiella sp. NPDC079379 TaxID=3364122 RepID=UPI0037C8306A
MQTRDFSAELSKLTSGFTPIIDTTYKAEDYKFLDLSVTNPILKEVDTSSAGVIQLYINTYLSKVDGTIAYGGYLEKRSIYDRSLYFSNTDAVLKRNIHLGLDIWCPQGTAVLVPVKGIVHSFKDNRNHGDYGPCIVLEHRFENLTFYTLYGHLTRSSLSNLSIGQMFEAGEILAHLGVPEENGDYAPHLHFQIIRDIQDNRGDYPGVSTLQNLDFYKKNCPDPQLLLKFNTL